MDNNRSKYVLITGATSGIGYQLTRLFAKDGYNLVIVARNNEELENTASSLKNEYGIEIIPLAKDLFQSQAPFELYDTIKEKSIRIDVLVNDAGQGEYGKFIETDIRRELDIIQLNINAYVVLTKLFLKEMVERGEGKILNVASIAGKVPGPYQSVYHGTKAFVHSFTEAIRSEIKETDTDVTITSLLPGATDTDFFRKAHMQNSKIVQEGSLADPAEVALDGYKALMNGDDMVISGFKNKAMVASSNLMPDSTVADMMKKQQEPANNNK